MAELETKEEARAALEHALELYAAAEVPDQVLDAIGRFLLSHSHARPNQARLRVTDMMGRPLIQRMVDLNGNSMFTVDLTVFGKSGLYLRVEIEPET
jgi:hypothetical protein